MAVEDTIRIDRVDVQFRMVLNGIFQQRLERIGFILFAIEHHATQRCSALGQLRQPNLMRIVAFVFVLDVPVGSLIGGYPLLALLEVLTLTAFLLILHQVSNSQTDVCCRC